MSAPSLVEVMQMQRTGERGANALKREFVVRVEVSSRASTDEVYAVLADLSTHTVWAGERQAEKSRLLTIDSPAAPARVGTEFSSTGLDPMGTFSDRSVVTEAQPGRVFEWVTEARLTTKKGAMSEWTNIQRYELEPASGGCRITCTGRITRIGSLPGMLRAFNVPGVRALLEKSAAKGARRTVGNLAAYAEERRRNVAGLTTDGR